MNRLIEHIERLLLLHDCVIIPDFGGFVLRSVSASHNVETNIFFPPRKEVVFNRTLNHNDGLLMESYMKKCKTDFSNAQQLVGNDVRLVKDTLENEGELSFGAVGLFVKDEERLVFMAGKNSDVLFDTSSFGLPAYHFLPLQNCKQSSMTTSISIKPDSVQSHKKKRENKNILYKIPVTRIFVQATTAVAAAILLFLLISTPVKDVNKESYKASFVPPEMMSEKTVDDIINEAFAKIENQPAGVRNQDIVTAKQEEGNKNVLPNENIAKAEIPSPPPATVPKSNTSTSPSAKAKSSINSNSAKKNFYVIIGSFDTKAQANRFIKNLKDVKNAGIITADGHVRVYAQGFVTEKSAQSYMNKLRQTTHKQAWVYKARD
jgi:cell division septation protein DedD